MNPTEDTAGAPGSRTPYVLPPEPKKNPVRLIIVGVLVVAGLVAALVFG